MNTIHYYIEAGALTPEIDPGSGTGTKRLFSETNFIEVYILNAFLRFSFPKRFIVNFFKEINNSGKRDLLIPDEILRDKAIKYIQFHPHPGGKLAFNFYVGDGEENSPDFKTEFTMSMIINLNTVVSEYMTAFDSLGRVRISGPRSIP